MSIAIATSISSSECILETARIDDNAMPAGNTPAGPADTHGIPMQSAI